MNSEGSFGISRCFFEVGGSLVGEEAEVVASEAELIYRGCRWMFPEMTLQERLNTNNITIDTELPEVDSDDHHIIGRNQPFTDQHLDYLGDNQVTQVSEDGKILTSLLQEPFPLTEGQFSQARTCRFFGL